jgi:molecular chaperone HtpG
VEEQAYADFYRQLTLDFEPPLLHVHLVADVPVDIRSILYVPRKLERGPLHLRADHGLKLYSKKVLIQEYNQDLLPEYLRFVEGVVDSQDIPLNISRETVQSSRAMQRIKRALTGRVLKALQEMAEERPDDYDSFWVEFGPFIKHGVATNPAAQDDLLPLLRFHSSKSGAELISLADYAARMPEGQEKMYYILGDDRTSVERSPHLDSFRSRDFEVLYLLDPLDGFMMQTLREYEDKPFQNVDDPGLELPEVGEAEAEPEPGVAQADFERLTARFERVLGDRVSEVRESRLLTDSPCRLVSPSGGPERDLQRVRRLLGQDFETPPKILELNRRHPLIQNLARLVTTQPDDSVGPGSSQPTERSVIDPTIEQLFENLLLLEGLHPNPAQMVPRIQDLLEAATRVEGLE